MNRKESETAAAAAASFQRTVKNMLTWAAQCCDSVRQHQHIAFTAAGSTVADKGQTQYNYIMRLHCQKTKKHNSQTRVRIKEAQEED